MKTSAPSAPSLTLAIALANLATNAVAQQFDPFNYNGPAHGVIGLANSSNLVTLDTALTEFATGAPQDPTLLAFRDALAPTVPAGDSFQYLVHEEAESWLRYANGEHKRGVGGEFAVVKPTGKKNNGATEDKGLTVSIDHRQGGKNPLVQQRWIANLKAVLLRCDVAELIALVEANATTLASINWGASNAAADPDETLEAMLELTGDARGVNASTLVFAGNAWRLRSAANRRLAAAGSFEEYTKTTAGLQANLAPFGVEQVLIGNQRYQSAANAKAKVKATAGIYAAYAQQGATANDPSNFKRFVDVTQGTDFAVHVEERPTHTLVTVMHRSVILCTSTAGLLHQPITNA